MLCDGATIFTSRFEMVSSNTQCVKTRFVQGNVEYIF